MTSHTGGATACPRGQHSGIEDWRCAHCAGVSPQVERRDGEVALSGEEARRSFCKVEADLSCPTRRLWERRLFARGASDGQGRSLLLWARPPSCVRLSLRGEVHRRSIGLSGAPSPVRIYLGSFEETEGGGAYRNRPKLSVHHGVVHRAQQEKQNRASSRVRRRQLAMPEPAVRRRGVVGPAISAMGTPNCRGLSWAERRGS